MLAIDHRLKPPCQGRALALVFFMASGLGACSSDVPPAANVQATVESTPRVGVATFARLRTHLQREAPASVLGKNESRLTAEIAARIATIAVDVGDEVAAGRLLIQLDDRDARLVLERAEAALAQSAARQQLAAAQLRRAQTLHAQQFISAEALHLKETELASVAADQRQAEVQVASARRMLEKCQLRAPYRAVVRTRQAQLGELAVAGAPLLTLAEVGEVQVVAQLQASDAAGLAEVDQVGFVAQGQRYPLRRLRISPLVQRESATVEARFAFVGAAPAIGSEGRLSWQSRQSMLPAELLVQRAGRYGVFVIDNDVARFHPLAGAQEGRPVAASLPDAALLAVQGRQGLQDGQRVQPILTSP